MILESSKISCLFYKGKYKRVCHLVLKSENQLAKPFYFRSLYLLKQIELSKKALTDYLHNSSLRLISLRNSFDEIIKDEEMMGVLVAVRSEEEVNEMMACLEREQQEKDDFRHYAELTMDYYCKKEKN